MRLETAAVFSPLLLGIWQREDRGDLTTKVRRQIGSQKEGHMNIKGLLFVPLATALLWTLLGSAMYIIYVAYRLLSAATGASA